MTKRDFRRTFVGRHLDELIAAASKNGYGCSFVFGDEKIKSGGRKELVACVRGKDNIVTKIC